MRRVWLILLLAAAVAGISVAAVMLVSSSPKSLSGTGLVTSTGGLVSTTDDRVKLGFYAGAVSGDTVVTIEPLVLSGTTPEGFKLGETMFSVKAVTNGTNITEFQGLVNVWVKYSSGDLEQANQNPLLLQLAYWTRTSGWVTLETHVDSKAGVAYASTSHLGYWAVITPSTAVAPTPTPTEL